MGTCKALMSTDIMALPLLGLNFQFSSNRLLQIRCLHVQLYAWATLPASGSLSLSLCLSHTYTHTLFFLFYHSLHYNLLEHTGVDQPKSNCIRQVGSEAKPIDVCVYVCVCVSQQQPSVDLLCLGSRAVHFPLCCPTSLITTERI